MTRRGLFITVTALIAFLSLGVWFVLTYDSFAGYGIAVGVLFPSIFLVQLLIGHCFERHHMRDRRW